MRCAVLPCFASALIQLVMATLLASSVAARAGIGLVAAF